MRSRSVGLGWATGIIAMLFAGAAGAQVELALRVDPTRALVYEPVKAEVVIRNNTGGVLAFDASDGAARFFFEMDRGRNEAVKQAVRNPFLFGTSLVPSEARTNSFDLASIYALQNPGVYKVRACLEWRNKVFASDAIEVEVRKGVEIARVIAGVPGEQSALRVYILEYLGKKNGEYAYLRIEDENSKTIYGMFNLGHIVRVRKPEIKVDEAGNVHVLFQSISMTFVHASFTPYGVPLFCRNYGDRSNSITLLNMPNGQISVSQPPSKKEINANLPELPKSSKDQPAADKKSQLGRGGLFGPKSE